MDQFLDTFLNWEYIWQVFPDLLKTGLLSRDEIHWLDEYHARVLREIGPMLDGETLAWLETATAPLPHDAKI